MVPVLAVAAVAVAAYSAYSSASAQGAAAHYQSQVAANNATIAQQNANYAIAAGEEKAQMTSMQNAARIGQIKAAIGANNIDVNSGSAADVQTSQREIGKLDEETTMNNALLQAYGYQVQGTGFTAQAGLDTATAGQAPVAEAGGISGSLLSGAKAIPASWLGSGIGGSGGSPANPGDF